MISGWYLESEHHTPILISLSENFSWFQASGNFRQLQASGYLRQSRQHLHPVSLARGIKRRVNKKVYGVGTGGGGSGGEAGGGGGGGGGQEVLVAEDEREVGDVRGEREDEENAPQERNNSSNQTFQRAESGYLTICIPMYCINLLLCLNFLRLTFIVYRNSLSTFHFLITFIINKWSHLLFDCFLYSSLLSSFILLKNCYFTQIPAFCIFH